MSVYFQILSIIIRWFSLLFCYKACVATSNKNNASIHSSLRLWLDLWTTRMTKMRMKMKAKRAAPQKERD